MSTDTPKTDVSETNEEEAVMTTNDDQPENGPAAETQPEDAGAEAPAGAEATPSEDVESADTAPDAEQPHGAGLPDGQAGAPVTPPPVGGGMDSKNKAVFAHLSAFLTFVGIPAPIGPLVAWLVLKDQDAYAADQAKEALNFNISFLLYSIVAGVSLILLVGFVLLPAVLILWFIFPILAAIAASRGEWYRYPMTLRIVN